MDPKKGVRRTFKDNEEAAAAGIHLLKRKTRGVQRHAEVHCLLQLPRLADAQGTEMLIVELADVGPSLCWAEPCSRGCPQLLLKFGVARAYSPTAQLALRSATW